MADKLTISFSTVYNTLELLKDKGRVIKKGGDRDGSMEMRKMWLHKGIQV